MATLRPNEDWAAFGQSASRGRPYRPLRPVGATDFFLVRATGMGGGASESLMMQKVIAGKEPEGATVDESPSIDVEFALFFGDTHRPMLRLAYLLTGSATQAEEAVQDCFAKVFERWARIDDPIAYMRRAVVNRCTSWHRHRAVVRKTESVVATDESYNDHPDELRDVLDALPARRRAVVILRFYEGLDNAEIAGTLAISEGTVKSTLHRALEQMKGTLR